MEEQKVIGSDPTSYRYMQPAVRAQWAGSMGAIGYMHEMPLMVPQPFNFWRRTVEITANIAHMRLVQRRCCRYSTGLRTQDAGRRTLRYLPSTWLSRRVPWPI